MNVAASWANEDYLAENFGVDQAQAVRSGYAKFQPSAGVKDVRVSATAVYRVSPHWSVTSSLTQTQLLGDAKKSPFVKDDSYTSLTMAVGYSF